MKSIDEMTQQEVIEAMNKIYEEAQRNRGFLDNVDMEVYKGLQYALTHNFQN